MLSPAKEGLHFVFRVDGDSRVGLGHLSRCRVLIELLLWRGHSVTLIGRLGYVPQGLSELGLEIVRLEDKDNSLKKINALKKTKKIDWLVIDSYDLDIHWETEVAGDARRILVVDDLANRPHYCNALLDQNIRNPLQSRYESLIPKDSKLLLGMDYLLARESFYEAAQGERNGVLVFLGGGDHSKQLLALIGLLKVRLVTTPVLILATTNYRVGSEILFGLPSGSELHVDIGDPSKLMQRAQCGIIRCGFSAYELALLGVPSVMICNTDVQREVGLALAQRSYGVVLEESDLDKDNALDKALDSAFSLKPVPLSTCLSSGATKLADFLEDSIYE